MFAASIVYRGNTYMAPPKDKEEHTDCILSSPRSLIGVWEAI